ncbi:MAG: hypothetical protein HKN82_14365, partial [Akkermansiaceae bacterium]|nr:hypothetical protein [Akkermansiaceae bacterium]
MTLVPAADSEQAAKPEIASVHEEIIKFFCMHCGQKLSSPAAFVGRSFDCPSCAKSNQVPGEKPAEPARPQPKELIKFFCCGCGQKLSVDGKIAGHTIDCPICSAPTKVPEPGKMPAPEAKPAAPAAAKPPLPPVVNRPAASPVAK